MGNVAKEISESLARRGHQVKVFNSDIGRNKDKLTSTKNLKIYYLKSFVFVRKYGFRYTNCCFKCERYCRFG